MSEEIRIGQRTIQTIRDNLLYTGTSTLGFGLLFLFFSSMKDLYGDENECIILRNRSKDYAIGLIILSIFCFLSMIPTKIQYLDQAQSIVLFFYLLLGVLYFFLLLLALKLDEPCEGLRVFTIVYLIFVSLMASIVFCIVGLFFCVLASERRQQN